RRALLVPHVDDQAPRSNHRLDLGRRRDVLRRLEDRFDLEAELRVQRVGESRTAARLVREAECRVIFRVRPEQPDLVATIVLRREATAAAQSQYHAHCRKFLHETTSPFPAVLSSSAAARRDGSARDLRRWCWARSGPT